MCYFITAVLPRSANLPVLTDIAIRHGRALKPQRNPSIEEHLEPGEHYFLTTQGHCDCGTFLGSLARDESKLERQKNTADNEELKLRRKGWSETKLKRWKEQKADRLTKSKSALDAANWESLLNDMLNSCQTSFVGLLLHSYNGPIEEHIDLRGREAASVTAETLAQMQEDILYEFRKKG
ncbi:hypothetical protein [Pseudanabaena mucicola]|uniref:hypothetical protein n=1 Tax=Pseudanabaena mucicola TaxID=71190 RepID=UPI002574FA07|nr:hypothetical protein [Pseudanabaena mucicola]